VSCSVAFCFLFRYYSLHVMTLAHVSPSVINRVYIHQLSSESCPNVSITASKRGLLAECQPRPVMSIRPQGSRPRPRPRKPRPGRTFQDPKPRPRPHNLVSRPRPRLRITHPASIKYSLRLHTEEWPGWVNLGGWLYTEIDFPALQGVEPWTWSSTPILTGPDVE